MNAHEAGNVFDMRLRRIAVSYKSAWGVDFEASPFTVLFGKNNSGKTNILEGLHGLFDFNAIWGRRHEDQHGFGTIPEGAMWVDLERGVCFDDAVTLAVSKSSPARWAGRVAFTAGGPFAVSVDQEDFASLQEAVWAHTVPSFLDQLSASPPGVPAAGPRVKKLMLRTVFLNWEFTDLNRRIEESIGERAGEWLCELNETGELISWESKKSLGPPRNDQPTLWIWNPEVVDLLEQITTLATELLPDFFTVSLEAWLEQPNQRDVWVDLRCSDGLPVESLGQGMTRWIATAVQIALYLIAGNSGLRMLREINPGTYSGHILLVDEPEAHLHPSAVASVVRWCRRMVTYGFTVLVASHHEEFLRSAEDDVTLVHVTQDEDGFTFARALPSRRTSLLLELATDIGVHPASTLSMLSAILFVEGPLDKAVLEEFADLELEAAGVKIVPIHGTKNLEGLITAELATELGIKIGVLTDATDPETMAGKPGRKRSSEERKVLRITRMAEEKGLPVPKSFGVPQADLLFALPAEAISAYLGKPFPGWEELVAECRNAEGKGPQDSVNWKLYARDNYGLRIDSTTGVREIVRALDLKHVSLPSIRKVVDDVVHWATA